MLLRSVLIATLVAACDVSPLSEIYDAGLARSDAGAGDAGGRPFPFDPSNFDPEDVPPGGELIVRSGTCTFDTADLLFDGDGCASVPSALYGNQGAVVIASADHLSIESDGELIVIGNRAAIFAVFDAAEIDGQIHAGARGAIPGPGANAASCDRAVEGGSQIGQIASGGGGGGFGTMGATGGPTNLNDGGRGGAPSGNGQLIPLQGGCDGAAGGGGANGGEAGRGGGALEISAKRAITVGGLIAAPGGGGGGGNQTGGGGGGGSGGAILLEAPSMSIAAGAILTANGGGAGAGGGFEASGGTGDPGAERTADPARGADVGGGSGGAGGAGTRAPAEGNDGDLGFGGGGGGGGAVGRIRLNGTSTCTIDGAALVSPPASGCAR